jgi:hypothetical protein
VEASGRARRERVDFRALHSNFARFRPSTHGPGDEDGFGGLWDTLDTQEAHDSAYLKGQGGQLISRLLGVVYLPLQLSGSTGTRADAA